MFARKPLTALAALGAITGLTVPAAASTGARIHYSRANVNQAHSPQLLKLLRHRVAQPPGSAKGIDVASYQESSGINWSRVSAAGYRFASIKVTEGTYYANGYAPADIAAARAAGLRVMAYVFAIPNGNGASSSPTAQADYAVNYLQSSGVSPLPAIELDIEYNPYLGGTCYGLTVSQMRSWIHGFVNEVRARTGVEPVMYAPPGWWPGCTNSSKAFSQDPLWVPAYTGGSSPPITAGWTRWAEWQYTSSGGVPGIIGSVDLDVLTPSGIPLLNPGHVTSTAGRPITAVAVRPLDPLVSRSYRTAGLPPRLSINGYGKITGTPTTAGSYSPTVTVHGSNGLSWSVRFSWQVS
jgi:GH25 family lysozyme M1 (1,4-beta-N-acetylmuramidase)